jgi:hypothetical protein
LCTGARERYQDSSRWSRPSSTSEIMTSYRSISSSSQFSADPRRRQSDSSFYNGGLAQVHITEKLEWSMLSTMNDNIRHDPTCWKRPVRNPISYLSILSIQIIATSKPTFLPSCTQALINTTVAAKLGKGNPKSTEMFDRAKETDRAMWRYNDMKSQPSPAVMRDEQKWNRNNTMPGSRNIRLGE